MVIEESIIIHAPLPKVWKTFTDHPLGRLEYCLRMSPVTDGDTEGGKVSSHLPFISYLFWAGYRKVIPREGRLGQRKVRHLRTPCIHL
jgi:hypothetical protein